MIASLRIQNVALIDEVSVNFAPGLNILTGETGAGKSIVVDSLGFLLGGRPARDFVRTGADFAHVEGMIEVREAQCGGGLRGLGVEADDGQLMLSRTMQQAKSVCRINGRQVTAGLLRDVAALFVDLHGQHEHQSLLDPAKQLSLIDGFCGQEIAAMKEELAGQLAEYRRLRKALKAIAGIGDQSREMELVRYQLGEIEAAGLKIGEEEELQERKGRLAGLDSLQRNTETALKCVTESESPGGGTPASASVGRALSAVADMCRLDPSLGALQARLLAVQSELDEIGWELGEYMEKLDAEPGELERVEQRLDFLYHMKKKYGKTIADVLKKQNALEKQKARLENGEQDAKLLKAELKKRTAQVMGICDRLHERRVAAARGVSKDISEVLRDVGMERADFRIEVSRKKAFGPEGNCEADFLISPNPGEPLKPLRRIASGGEMSRVMLAIKTVMAEADSVSTVIFDEVDAGISGRTAQKVAEKLAEVSRHRQILCITHLPQIAAMADTHFQIEKRAKGERTTTTVRALTFDRATEELARLIGGRSITDSTKKAAMDMKAQAAKLKGEQYVR